MKSNSSSNSLFYLMPKQLYYQKNVIQLLIRFDNGEFVNKGYNLIVDLDFPNF